ncbi:putative transport protein HsrA [Amycolatopsis sp. M39]|nr:putative transport protein HsrA [Amycolatopsis sp. M39]
MRPTAPQVATPAPARIGARLAIPLVASATLNPINTTLISVALVPIGQSFGVGPAQTAWLVTALYVASAVGQPVMGLFVDRFGARRVLVSGAAVVIVASAIGLLPVPLGGLVAVRAMLGLGTCAGFPAAMAVLRKHAEATGQGVPSRMLSLLAICGQTVMVLGPPLGGALIALLGWPAIFAVNIPLAVISLVLALVWVPRDDRSTLTHAPVDVGGILLFSATLIVLLLFVMAPSVRTSYLLAIAAALAAALVRVELRVRKPFIDLRSLGANAPLLRTYLRQALALLIVYAIMYGYVQWLESARGLSESAAGALLLPMSAVAVLAAAVSGKPHTMRARLIANAFALLGGSALLLFVDTGTWVVALVGLGAIFGISQGLSSVTNQTALYRQTPTEMMGTASGLFRTSQYLGAMAASALIAHSFGGHATSAGLHNLGWILLVIAAVLLVVTVFDRALKRSTA